MRRILAVAALLLGPLSQVAHAGNTTFNVTAGAGTALGAWAYGSGDVSFFNLVCDPTTEGRCASVNASGQVGVTGPVTLSTTPSIANGSGVVLPPPAIGQTCSVTRPANTTAYTGNQFVLNNMSGNATPMHCTVSGTNGGKGYITHAIATTSGTGTTTPPAFSTDLYDATPNVVGISDQNTAIGPYVAQITGGQFLGTITCPGAGKSWAFTNDTTNTGPWWTECSASNAVMAPLPFQAVSGQVYVDGMTRILGAYTPISGEVYTLVLSGDNAN